MSTAAAASSPVAAPSKGLHVGLWVVQALLALAFGMSGFMKVITPIADLASKMSWVAGSPEALVRFIGISEVAGAIGLILPAATRIKPGLTALAGLGLLVVMVLGAGVHAMHGEWNVLPVNVVLGGLAAFVAWGRFKKAPIAGR